MRLIAILLAGFFAHMVFSAAAPAMTLSPVNFSDIPGWDVDSHAQALAVFERSCERMLSVGTAGRSERACRDAPSYRGSDDTARRFFETYFQPHRTQGTSGSSLFTGYFEPELAAGQTRSDRFSVPLLAPPRNLVALKSGQDRGRIPEGYSHAILYGGTYHLAPTRAEIENGIMGDTTPVLAWLDPIDAYFLHVQGSGRLRFADGTSQRVGFSAKNGHPYSSIGKILIERGAIGKDAMSMQTLRAWLEADIARARTLMQENRSYIFFRLVESDARLGPIGQQSVPLTPMRSLAVDLNHHKTGTPMWLETNIPGPGGVGTEPFRHLMIAQDTGSAIRGVVRGDIFFGTGDAAGARAGMMQAPGSLIVLLPRAAR